MLTLRISASLVAEQQRSSRDSRIPRIDLQNQGRSTQLRDALLEGYSLVINQSKSLPESFDTRDRELPFKQR